MQRVSRQRKHPSATLDVHSHKSIPEFDYKDFPFFVKHFPTVGKSPK